MTPPPRCPWAGDDPLMMAYHDEEWGVPLHEERGLFEFLVLEGAQAGLSWKTILHKRAAYRRAFDGFDADKVARYGDADVARLLADPGIVRNRLKVASAIRNATAVLALREQGTSLDVLLWRLAGGSPKKNGWRRAADVPARTAVSDAMSADLKRRGFNFVGTTICYALMQAVGMVDDHVIGCFRRAPRPADPPADRP